MLLLLEKYGLHKNLCIVEPFGSGLINTTWKVQEANNKYIFQRINTDVFKHPFDIADNVGRLAKYFKEVYPDYLFVNQLATTANEVVVKDEQGKHYRMFPFVDGSFSYDVVNQPSLAHEAASQFGKFTKLLSGFNALSLHTTLPDFHNLSLRYQQFETALQTGNKERIVEAEESIAFLHGQKNIVETFEKIKKSKNFKFRVTHHDTKISNILFDKNDKGLCVIDLDTVMPGLYISDAGDMMRTFLSPVSEEEKDFSKIEVREEYFQAILSGYLSEMGCELSEEEIKHFAYAGKFMIYMQAIRFLTDHINDDAYYGARYPGQNLVRANNQITMLKLFLEKEEIFNGMINNYIVKNSSPVAI
ncbi:phosphotransferase enzyme family protein [Chitinophagaceae bacterium LWZ2-11]